MAIDFPRTTKPESITSLEPRKPLRSVGQSGVQQIRNITQAGWTWQETFTMLRSGDPADEAIMMAIDEGEARGQDFNIKHLLTPGSGKSPMGTGTSGVTVSGAQSGSPITTTGWPASTNNVVRKGDLIQLGGISHTMKVRSDANSDIDGNADIDIMPPVFDTVSDSASVTLSDIDIVARISNVDGRPSSQSVDYWGSVTVTFMEVVS